MNCEMECLAESFSIFQTRWPGLAKEQVEVLLSNEFDHETNDELESIIERVWSAGVGTLLDFHVGCGVLWGFSANQKPLY